MPSPSPQQTQVSPVAEGVEEAVRGSVAGLWVAAGGKEQGREFLGMLGGGRSLGVDFIWVLGGVKVRENQGTIPLK